MSSGELWSERELSRLTLLTSELWWVTMVISRKPHSFATTFQTWKFSACYQPPMVFLNIQFLLLFYIETFNCLQIRPLLQCESIIWEQMSWHLPLQTWIENRTWAVQMLLSLFNKLIHGKKNGGYIFKFSDNYYNFFLQILGMFWIG